jgi:hypothetical protein
MPDRRREPTWLLSVSESGPPVRGGLLVGAVVSDNLLQPAAAVATIASTAAEIIA